MTTTYAQITNCLAVNTDPTPQNTELAYALMNGATLLPTTAAAIIDMMMGWPEENYYALDWTVDEVCEATDEGLRVKDGITLEKLYEAYDRNAEREMRGEC